MSNGNGISFVHDLVAMATAADKVPQLEERIAELEATHGVDLSTISLLETRIIDHTNAHGETKARLQNAEVARDDAELRFLEADDAKLAAVRAMRVVIGEAEAFIKAMTPEVVKPSYEGKWLWDVQGWSNISLTQWLENGGSASRFVSVKLAEHTSPNPLPVSSASIDHLDPGGGEDRLTQEADAYISKHGEGWPPGQSETDPTANILGTQQQPSPSASYDSAESKESASTTTSEGPCEADPTSADDSGFINEKLLGSSDKTLEGDNSDPFAASRFGNGSPTADTGGAGTQESALEKPNDDDLWAIPSRASHYSS